MGCHFLLQRMKVKSESEVAQSCLTLSDPMACSLPGSSVHGIFQARVLEWGAIAFSDTGIDLLVSGIYATAQGRKHYQIGVAYCCGRFATITWNVKGSETFISLGLPASNPTVVCFLSLTVS